MAGFRQGIDAQNRRIGKTINDTLVRAWLYQGQLTPVAELDGAGTVVSRFVYATGVNVPGYLVRNDSTYRLIRDHLGSVRLVVNVATGNVVQRIDYDEFGIESSNTNPGWQPFGYAGGLADEHTQLVRFGARDYDPAVGRWTAKDPIGFAGGDFGLYSYVDNDPVNLIDPEGLYSWSDFWGDAGQFTVGFGDAVSLGLTKRLRSTEWYGGDDYTDPCGTLYRTGGLAGDLVPVFAVVSVGKQLKLWIRIGRSYSRSGDFRTIAVRLGSNRHWREQINSPFLRELNRRLHELKLPGSSWRTADPGHLHLWRR